jgi:hypothetical protein
MVLLFEFLTWTSILLTGALYCYIPLVEETGGGKCYNGDDETDRSFSGHDQGVCSNIEHSFLV